MELLVISLEYRLVLLVLHHHLHLLVRGMMIIVMDLMQAVHIYMKMIIKDHGMKLDDNSNGIEAGSAYIYENDNKGSWNEVTKLIASDGTDNDYFGYSVSLAPPFAIIGARGDDNSNGIDAGSAYIYENDNNGSWNEVRKLIASDGAAGDQFGMSVSIAPPFALIGAYRDDNSNGIDAGSAYIYENDNNRSWNEVSK
eukprot:87886_1